MSLDTNFNVSPYYDDYSEDKKFQRVLFKPAVALQARELTQLQTILQKQVERFGNNIYKEGTIIEGCSMSLDGSYSFVKITDLDTGGSPVAPSTYKGYYAKGATSNTTAKVAAYADGLTSQDPNLTTLYIDYLTTGISEAKTFTTTENIEIHSNTAYNANTLIKTVTVAGAQITNAATAVGDGFAVTTSEGFIYSKGHFLKVSSNTVIASKYTNKPNNVSIGFDVTESIVSSDADSTLLDNASGYNNENAPGADRLKLDPFLVAIPTADSRSNSNFLSVMDFQNGLPIAKKLTTQYNVINDEMSKRTYDESGDYSIRSNNMAAEAANTSHFNLLVGPGHHYVKGNRSQQYNTTRLPVQKSVAFANTDGVVTTQNMGNYIIVDELVGGFNSNTMATVSLRDTAKDALTNGAALNAVPGAEIGTAKVRGFQWHAGVQGTVKAQYKLFLIDIKMSAGKAFRNVKAASISGSGIADAVLENSQAVIKEPRSVPGIYQFPKNAIKTTNSVDYTYRTQKQVTSSSNTLTLTSVSGVFPYSGVLTSSQKKEFIIRPLVTAGGIANNAAVDTDLISISVSSGTATIVLTGALASTISTSAAWNVTFPEKKVNAAPLTKTLKTIFIKLDAANNTTTNVGPWSLGHPDVDSIENVYVGSTYANTNTQSKTGFKLEKGQTDTFYGLSQLSKLPTQSLGASDKILVEAKVFDAGAPASGSGFFTVSSYLASDGTTPLTPQEVPVYESDNGFSADLRDVHDVRPQVANTGVVATTIGAATINPSATESFPAGDLFLAAPNKQLQCNIEFYLGRIDSINITKEGYVTTKRGAAASRPLPPTKVPDALQIGTIAIPPYPSLTSAEARTLTRKNQTVIISPKNVRRYTMQEIGKIDKRLKNIEYYTTLTQLETKTKDMAITDSNGNDRFKNGILVDPATDFNSADLNNREFRCGIDETATEFHPSFVKDTLDLIVANTSNVIELNGTWTLPAQEEPFIVQDIATSHRPCTETYFKYIGSISLDPMYDTGYDETVVGTKDIFIDTASGMQDMVDNLNEIYPLTKTNIDQIGTSSDVQTQNTVTSDTQTTDYGYYGWGGYEGYNYGCYNGYGGGYGGDYWGGNWGWGGSTSATTETTVTETTTTTTDTYLKTTQQLSMGYEESTTPVGDFVTDISISSFMRARDIRIAARGLRPNTRHYFFFDNKDINAYTKKGTVDSIATPTTYMAKNAKNVFICGVPGGTTTTDFKGQIQAVFSLPKGTFMVGDRQLMIADVSSIDNLDTATSTASETYNAYNYSVEKESVTLSTRTPTFDLNTSTDEFSNSSVDIDTGTSSNTTMAYNDWYGDYFWGANGYPYANSSTNTGVTVVTDAPANTTTTGTGSSAQTAITGSGGGYTGVDYMDYHTYYMDLY
jgi:hypothetical protein